MPVRYDVISIKATKTAEGFIQDSPVVGRVGVLTYYNADGSIRKEFRPPEEAFHADSLESLKGKPVTIGHKAMVNADNAGKVNPIGCVLSTGRQDGDDIVADLIIHNLDTAARQLSCGYSLDLDETPGEYQGQKYDAIQRNIRYNHVAVVPKGRAGNARLNMDGDQLYNEEEDKKMAKVRLDNGLEYEAAAEVAVAVEQMRKDAAELEKEKVELKKKSDKLEAERDVLKAEKGNFAEQLKNTDKEHAEKLDEAVKQRVSLLSVAEKHQVEKADELNERQLKEAVITAVRGDSIELKEKSDEYINAAFDLLKDDTSREDAMASQRETIYKKDQKDDKNKTLRSDDVRKKMIENLENAYKGGKE